MTLARVPPAVRLSVNVSVYSPITAPPDAESLRVMVHWLLEPVAGTVGVNSISTLSDLPRLSKYSTESG